MKIIYIMACAVIGITAGCLSHSQKVIPAESALISAASVNGKFKIKIDRYDPKEKIAVVSTPGWKPERKQYQYDGKVWIPLWSPCYPSE